jgi:hypothetical protein
MDILVRLLISYSNTYVLTYLSTCFKLACEYDKQGKVYKLFTSLIITYKDYPLAI